MSASVSRARPVTIKIGGVAGQHAASLEAIARGAPGNSVVVHGGGGDVAAWSRRLGLETRTHDGLRITDAETLEVVVAVLGGLVNTRIVAALLAAGRPAVGLTGVDAGLLRLRRREPVLGEVGEVVGVDASLLDTLVAAATLPVVAPLGVEGGMLLNVNADEVAGAIAAARGGLLLLCTDVGGVTARDGRLLAHLDARGAERMLADGSASAGMRPKLRAALVAAAAGCEVRIVDGRAASEVRRALRGEPAGTMVSAA